jgi:hypothetical protein
MARLEVVPFPFVPQSRLVAAAVESSGDSRRAGLPGASRSFPFGCAQGQDDNVVEKAGRTNASAPTWSVVIIAASSL